MKLKRSYRLPELPTMLILQAKYTLLWFFIMAMWIANIEITNAVEPGYAENLEVCFACHSVGINPPVKSMPKIDERSL